jgi:hypothetical protein
MVGPKGGKGGGELSSFFVKVPELHRISNSVALKHPPNASPWWLPCSVPGSSVAAAISASPRGDEPALCAGGWAGPGMGWPDPGLGMRQCRCIPSSKRRRLS